MISMSNLSCLDSGEAAVCGRSLERDSSCIDSAFLFFLIVHHPAFFVASTKTEIFSVSYGISVGLDCEPVQGVVKFCERSNSMPMELSGIPFESFPEKWTDSEIYTILTYEQCNELEEYFDKYYLDSQVGGKRSKMPIDRRQ